MSFLGGERLSEPENFSVEKGPHLQFSGCSLQQAFLERSQFGFMLFGMMRKGILCVFLHGN